MYLPVLPCHSTDWLKEHNIHTFSSVVLLWPKLLGSSLKPKSLLLFFLNSALLYTCSPPGCCHAHTEGFAFLAAKAQVSSLLQDQHLTHWTEKAGVPPETTGNKIWHHIQTCHLSPLLALPHSGKKKKQPTVALLIPFSIGNSSVSL